ncbi:fatty acid desaturase [Pendulispora brunnea]|uniref:Fatty acid desaturase n=1 Tax=Pendulispora brunnea TaxID=2905690 RepID=A0ABZ2KGP4_9BACT
MTAHATTLPWWLVAPVGGLLVAWHGSFQHETIHGHPTPWRKVNAWFGSMPLSLWLPYGIYREQHEAHHRTPHLTDPLDDPESFYVSKETWAEMGALRRAFLHVNSTLVGRLVFGPPMVVVQFALGEVRLLLQGAFPRRRVRAWLLHFAGLGVVFAWLGLVCHVSLAQYVLLFVYPGLGLTLLRSFIEHRPAAVPEHRVGIVEAGTLWSLLFLNNNLHVVHHEAPWVPWYELPALYRAQRRAVLESNGGFVFPGYLAVAARFAFRPKDSPVHPW